MNHPFDEISMEFRFKIPFIFHSKNVLLSPCYILTFSSMHIHKFYVRNVCTPAKYSYFNGLQSILLNLELFPPVYATYDLGFLEKTRKVTSTWLYTRIRSETRGVPLAREWRRRIKVENGHNDNNNRALGVCESRRLYREWAGPPMARRLDSNEEHRGRPYNRIGISPCHRNFMESDGARTATPWSPPTPTITLCGVCSSVSPREYAVS